VRREDFEPLYGQFPNPLKPSGRNISREPARVNAGLAAICQANRSRTADLPLFRRIRGVAGRGWVWPDGPSTCGNYGWLSPDAA
jgi:hypothetical protein